MEKDITATVARLNKILQNNKITQAEDIFHPEIINVRQYMSSKELAIRSLQEGNYWNCGGRNSTLFVPDKPDTAVENESYDYHQFLTYFQDVIRQVKPAEIKIKKIDLKENNSAAVTTTITYTFTNKMTQEELVLQMSKNDNSWLINELFFKFALPV